VEPASNSLGALGHSLSRAVQAALRVRTARQFLTQLNALRREKGLSHAELAAHGRARGIPVTAEEARRLVTGPGLPTARRLGRFLRACDVGPIEETMWQGELTRLTSPVSPEPTDKPVPETSATESDVDFGENPLVPADEPAEPPGSVFSSAVEELAWVTTTPELLARLDALRKEKGLSYARISSRCRRVGIPFSGAGAHLLITGAVLPAPHRLAAFLQACDVDPLEARLWLDKLARLRDRGGKPQLIIRPAAPVPTSTPLRPAGRFPAGPLRAAVQREKQAGADWPSLGPPRPQRRYRTIWSEVAKLCGVTFAATTAVLVADRLHLHPELIAEITLSVTAGIGVRVHVRLWPDTAPEFDHAFVVDVNKVPPDFFEDSRPTAPPVIGV